MAAGQRSLCPCCPCHLHFQSPSAAGCPWPAACSPLPEQPGARRGRRAFPLPREAVSLPPRASPMPRLCPALPCLLQSSNPLQTGCCPSHLLKPISCALLPAALRGKHRAHFVSEPSQKPRLMTSDFSHLLLVPSSAHSPGMLKALIACGTQVYGLIRPSGFDC